MVAATAPAQAVGGEPPEELDGVICRGPLASAEALRLTLAAAVLLPLRLVVGMLVLLLYYLVGHVCKLFAGWGPALPRGVEKEGGSYGRAVRCSSSASIGDCIYG